MWKVLNPSHQNQTSPGLNHAILQEKDDFIMGLLSVFYREKRVFKFFFTFFAFNFRRRGRNIYALIAKVCSLFDVDKYC